MNEEDSKLAERIAQIFPSPEVASAIVDIAVHNRPQGWSRKSNAPYYKEKYAKQIKEYIDRMMENGNDISYRYDRWCSDDAMSRQTLYNRINQSIRYLVEKMDTPDRKYGMWYDSIKLRRTDIAVVISFIPGFGTEDNGPKPEETKPKASLPIWKQEMEEWLEGDSLRPYCQDKLMLDDAEVALLKNQLSQLSNIQYSITHGSVKIIKMKI